ncbi:serine hydrolase domain-containing protein [Reyranella aquatilis]|nr:serine hydrolase [Reyranella aquatilis]
MRYIQRTIIMAAFALAAMAAPASAQEPRECGTPASLADGWAVAAPADVAMDAKALCGLDAFISQWPGRNVHAVLIARHGKLVMERYYAGVDERMARPLGIVRFAADVKHDMRSVSKSVTSLLIGIALAEGRFPTLDSSVFDTFPQYGDLATPEKRRITFRDLLTMSAGLKWDESRGYADPLSNEYGLVEATDPFRYLLSQPMAAAPGTVYAYNGGATALLAAALAKGTGRSLNDYAREKLFVPLQVLDFDWDEMGVSHQLGAAGGLRLRPRDMLKLGQIMLTDGQWNGRRVLPPGWAAESATPRINGEGLYFYGYQWWLGRSFSRGHELTWTAAFGLGGQRLYIVPALDLVLAITAGHYGSGQGGSPLQAVIPSAILNGFVLPAVLRGSP